MLKRTLFLASIALAAVAVAAEQIRPAQSSVVPRIDVECRQKQGEARQRCEQESRTPTRAVARPVDDDRDARWRSQQLQLALQRCDILSGSTRHACIMGSREEFLN
jgi:hypothetical protein